MSIPLIALAGAYETVKIIRDGSPVAWPSILLGIIIAAISAYGCIHAFLHFIRKIGVVPFVIYRLLLGGFLLFMFL
jgi:undecaprenyl-diphosphatase